MKKILVPVDFSEHTDITCSYALKLADAYKAELMLFHTYFDQVVLTDTTFPDSMNMNAVYNEELIREMHTQAEVSMKKLLATLEKRLAEEKIGNVKLNSAVVGGDIEMELKMVCGEYQPEMVIMGTRGLGQNINVWGRVSTYIINHAKVPVLTVPEIKTFMGFKNIMFTADLSEGNAAAILQIFNLMKPFQSTLNVVHFQIGKDGEEEKMEVLKNEFVTLEQKGNIRFELVSVEADNQKSLDDYIANNGIEIIAFQPHKRSVFYNFFTKNITKKNLFSTNIPLLAIPIQ
ncbi:MAG: universal stress protein [Bacteroidales bacterium]|nr:universal stress protein [Bacteroidales bacterium]